ncbi:hypothetical protein BV881_12415 [Streptomyces sp. ZL-24]|uniref:hypothetical protein n=1 Tax=Streptomyces sp. ZL-24 TaxID=1933029 RepID=UPI000CD40958|nr:hypothetical protein [Streptomyces sp. ZL-24]POG47135.1 hypothetical protein BV881_12415 [Streptomyces sp. ZL-24]
MSAGAGPLRVVTSDGAVWVRAAVTRAGLGLYCPEGVVSCPRFVMATLAELAEHGVKAAPVEDPHDSPLHHSYALGRDLPEVTPEPLAYGPTGYRCGCGKDAHSNLVPCAPDGAL